jgi:hypothetical protein
VSRGFFRGSAESGSESLSEKCEVGVDAAKAKKRILVAGRKALQRNPGNEMGFWASSKVIVQPATRSWIALIQCLRRGEALHSSKFPLFQDHFGTRIQNAVFGILGGHP